MVNKNACIDTQRDNFNQLPYLKQWFCNGTQTRQDSLPETHKAKRFTRNYVLNLFGQL